MATLRKAHQELFRRSPDEAFSSLDDLRMFCQKQKDESIDLWERPDRIMLDPDMFLTTNAGKYSVNDWSFSQLCRMANVSKETINRLSPPTASKALCETLPRDGKPLQLLATGDLVRSVHGFSYTRLWNLELLDVVQDVAPEFCPPQVAFDGTSTGLYCGEQDMFVFLIDPTGWIDIGGESFAPGFFIWNSEVGRRSLGVQTFWFQRICQNHIVWDAMNIVDFSRKHTANVHDGLDEVRRLVGNLVKQRDRRRDSFAAVIERAMKTKLGVDADDAKEALAGRGIPSNLLKDALEIARKTGGFTIFAMVDALTRMSQSVKYAGDRVELDSKIGELLTQAV